MTIIAARQFWRPWEGEKKWTLFTDDCVTIWQAQVSAARKYRPKLRELVWKNCRLVIASCWWTREIDVVLNLLQAKLDITKVKDTIGLTYLIQTVLVEARKEINELSKDPSVWLLILEPETNTLRHSDDYSVFQVNNEVEIVAGSWEQAFFSLSKYNWFLWALKKAVESDEYCEFPLYAYRDGEMFTFWHYQDEYEISQILAGNTISHEPTPIECANEPYVEPSWLTETLVAKLW